MASELVWRYRATWKGLSRDGSSRAGRGRPRGAGRRCGEFVFEQRAHGSGDELRQMADPGAENVMRSGSMSRTREPKRPTRPPFVGEDVSGGIHGCCRSIPRRARLRRRRAHCRRVGAADFFARHGMARESQAGLGVVFVTGTGTNRAFDAATS